VQGVDGGAFFHHQATEDGRYLLCQVARDCSFRMQLMALELINAALGLSCIANRRFSKDVLARKTPA
jgi:hypothetical protein